MCIRDSYKRRQQGPNEIQEGLHALVRFYTSAGCILEPDGLGEGCRTALRWVRYPVLFDDFEAGWRKLYRESVAGIERTRVVGAVV